MATLPDSLLRRLIRVGSADADRRFGLQAGLEFGHDFIDRVTDPGVERAADVPVYHIQ